jgi:hypothetical protein
MPRVFSATGFNVIFTQILFVLILNQKLLREGKSSSGLLFA